MPLIKSASREAVGENYKRELAADKSKAQSLAIALAEQRRAKERAKMWKGGKAERDDLTIDAEVPYSDMDLDDFEDPADTSDTPDTHDTLAKALARRKRG